MRRINAVLAGGIGVLVLLSGCQSVPEEQVEENNRILTEIVERLDQSEYERFKGTYLDDPTETKHVGVSLRCDGCDEQVIIDAILGEVWLSEITPILTISVKVWARSGLVTERYRIPDDEAELTERFGERPVESIPKDG